MFRDREHSKVIVCLFVCLFVLLTDTSLWC